VKRNRRRERSSCAWPALAASLLLYAIAPPAYCWDSRTHQLITRLAIAALPAMPIKTGFERNAAQLEEYSIEPDTVLRPMYGEAEARRHYIDLEYFGTDPFAQLDPDFDAMEHRFGVRTLDRSGTLPWSIEAEAAATASALGAGDCRALLRHAGYLAHYVGDLSQPLHSTRFYDGITADDRGLHARLESAIDHRIREIEALAPGQVRWQPIASVWAPVIAELKESHALVPQVIAADRTARAESGHSHAAYTRALMGIEQDMIVHQIAASASLLASIWAYEDRQAGAPSVCMQR
jgi:zinc dependent phospholipase C